MVKNKKQFNTGASREVTQPSTGPAQRGLTSEFWWDRVLFPWYDRTMQNPLKTITISWQSIT